MDIEMHETVSESLTPVDVSLSIKDTLPDCCPTATMPLGPQQLMHDTCEGSSKLLLKDRERLPLVSKSSTLFRLADANWSS